ncbi:LCP family protein [Anaerovorax odorimutans]|uniref:LCP family protein n=1 Tax=Anaerovorax odorimutans TaxID=109327 RepID=UPI00042A309E|nr:LCP family protein [Anaerovorax odorimutans]
MEKELERKVNEKKKLSKSKKNKSALQSFLQTFIGAFIIFIIIFTPMMTVLGGVAEYNPFGDDNPVLEEEMEDVLVSSTSPFFNAFKESKRVNVLLLGVNSGLTDTIMLVSFDKEAKKVDVISVPRDTYYHRPGFDSDAECKINAAYKGDPVNTAKAVSDVLLGMPINYYAVIDYKGVSNIVDAMGGVPMDIDFHMVYNDPYDKPPLRINIPKGYQVLDGEHAVQFLRYRHGYAEGDIGRVKAQQRFVKSAFKQCLSFDLPKIANTVFQNVTSDINIGTAVSLATKGMGMNSEDITTYTIPYTPQPEAPFYVYPKSEEIGDMIEEIYSIESNNTSETAIKN